MPSSDEKSADGGDDLLDSPTNDSFQTSVMPVHMYPLSSTSQFVRLKRMQVKNACTKCQKACKKCDQARPCLRCVKYGYAAEECMDSQRKERKKGAKRGPYKKRDGKGNNIAQNKEPTAECEPDTSPQPGGSTSTGSIPVGYPPGFYAQFPLAAGHKPGEPVYYPQFYLAPVPAPPNAGQGESSTYPPPPQFFPATFMTAYAQSYPPYVVHSGADGQMHYPGAPSGSAAGHMKPPVLDDEKVDQSDASPKN
ncbi:hypothetical protein B0H13DRAFT_948281 [Mycena leptocephala]|nr:hypothetical protein B0H13DRAFT_948281 [Mycena leptocephala]